MMYTIIQKKNKQIKHNFKYPKKVTNFFYSTGHQLEHFDILHTILLIYKIQLLQIISLSDQSNQTHFLCENHSATIVKGPLPEKQCMMLCCYLTEFGV